MKMMSINIEVALEQGVKASPGGGEEPGLSLADVERAAVNAATAMGSDLNDTYYGRRVTHFSVTVADTE